MSVSATPRTVARRAPLSVGFSRREHWSGLPRPPPGDPPDPGIEAGSPALQADSSHLSASASLSVSGGRPRLVVSVNGVIYYVATGDCLLLLRLLLGFVCDVTGVRTSFLWEVTCVAWMGHTHHPCIRQLMGLWTVENTCVHSLAVPLVLFLQGVLLAVASQGPRLSRNRRHQPGGLGSFLTVPGPGWSGVKVPTARSLVRALFLASGRPSPRRAGSSCPPLGSHVP